MKKIHIILLVVVALGAGTIFLSVSNSETYGDFGQAQAAPNQTFHIVGTLNMEKEMSYNPAIDVNLFTFYLIDNKGVEKKVALYKTKPQDFERSEQIVVIGRMNGDIFEAKDILTKCPSKYNDAQEIEGSETASTM